MIDFTGEKSAISQALLAMTPSLERVTKRLKLQALRAGDAARKLVISTNFLPKFGFEPDVRCVEEVRPGVGLVVRLATPEDESTKKVYLRRYKNRKVAEEAMLDIRSQQRLNDAFGPAQSVHITFTKGLITIEPLYEAQEESTGRLFDIRLPSDLTAFSASLVSVVSQIESLNPAFLTLSVSAEVEQSSEFTIFQVALRRIGFALERDAAGLYNSKREGSGLTHPVGFEALDTAKLQATGVRFNASAPLHSFVTCSSGVDIHSMESQDFQVGSVLEWRPAEKRDFDSQGFLVKDNHETGAACAVINSKHTRVLFNEDFYSFDPTRELSTLTQANLMVASLCCTEHSNLKTSEAKQRSIDELSTTVDMVVPMLKALRAGSIPTLLIENVPSFLSSGAFNVVKATLEADGYKVYSTKLNGKDFNGYTTRPRAFVFATKLNAPFSFPKPVSRTRSFWNDVVLPNMKELLQFPCTENSVATAIESGRIRYAKEGDVTAPTLTKSENKKVKDATRVKLGDWYYWPTVKMQREIMGISPEFQIDYLTVERQMEIIGQSVCSNTHHHLMESIKAHLLAYVGPAVADGLFAAGDTRATCTPALSAPADSLSAGQLAFAF